MLNENIKAIRKAKGLSQEELAIKLNVVRQTISKWEQGLSVPDSDLLISLSEALDTPVGTLLGETMEESKPDDLKVISEKLEVINLQSLEPDLFVCVDRNCFCGFMRAEQSISGLGLQ